MIQQEAEPFSYRRMGVNRTAQCRVRDAADHSRLDSRHQLAGFHPEQ